MGDSPEQPTEWEGARGSAERGAAVESRPTTSSQLGDNCTSDPEQCFASEQAGIPIPGSGHCTSGRPALERGSSSMDVEVHPALSGGVIPPSFMAGSISTGPGHGIELNPSSFHTPVQVPRPALQPQTPQPFPVKLGAAATPSTDVSSVNVALNLGGTNVPQGQSAWHSPVVIPSRRQLFRPAVPEKSEVGSVETSDDEARSGAAVAAATTSVAWGAMSPPSHSCVEEVRGAGSETSWSASSSNAPGSDGTSSFERTLLDFETKPKVIAHIVPTSEECYL